VTSPYSPKATYRILAIRTAALSKKVTALASDYREHDRGITKRLMALATQLHQLSEDAACRRGRDPLPPGQARVMLFLQKHINTQGRPPTRERISKALGFRSANAVQCHLACLAKKGYVQILPRVTGGIRLKKLHVPT
jgi:hypothetical protein